MPYRVIGQSLPRADAWEKVRGRPIYAGDTAIPGMLHGRIVGSPYASARIARLDTRAARALPGVAAVLTHEDVPRNELRMELPDRMAEATAGAVLATHPGLRRQGGRDGRVPARAARVETRRPVQLIFSHEESFTGHGKRHPCKTTLDERRDVR
jgi:CO/xanthine dehydrogenase Mo-binding subunit